MAHGIEKESGIWNLTFSPVPVTRSNLKLHAEFHLAVLVAQQSPSLLHLTIQTRKPQLHETNQKQT
jgi:hypothetical protein